ncbi:hypothetical protein TVAG_054140 [Trichomonas vaginalis G3]|uniref:Uncharacterized protein n=1 Tax=Trichomonas vaginalis (strain ATCC PRA-98 / G3) TaxID=412133 RepID=A2FMQ2_TRIV3|nr:hypothetical protein TVAGG3_0938360 [Trichomonas vaginalis G3]EAX93809.1 hypothetical protein TVAG_054140 [Trichomonas vaginalis G3]KAI5486352.1 hypothetical protein TVAGG3_0938360 [Trichomonas vaginalis G3]|eukprot:XP_001306739.1 hypothetical protein [Trichomonas vaginalis G3]
MKKNLFDYSSSSGDEDIQQFWRSRHAPTAKEKALLREMNIDNLLKERKLETEYLSESKSQETKNQEKKYITEIKEKANYETVDFEDGSIFGEKHIEFPKGIIDLIETTNTYKNSEFDKFELVEKWVYHAALKAPQDILINSRVVYRILLTLAKTKNIIFGESIFNILKFVPMDILDFSYIYNLFKLILNTDSNLIIYPILLMKPQLYHRCSTTVIKQMVYILIGGILTSAISRNPLFYVLPSNLLNSLSELSKSEQRKSANAVAEILKELPIESMGELVSFLPIDSAAAEFTSTLAFSMLFYYLQLGLPDPENPKGNMDLIVQNIHTLKNLCTSGELKNILTASAVIATLEKLTVIEINFKQLDKRKITRMSHVLHMSFYTKNHVDLVALKEQFHFTRVQLDNWSDEYFQNEVIEENPWGDAPGK